MLATTLIVITIAQPAASSCEPGACGGEAMASAFEDAVRRVLGRETAIRSETTSVDLTDEDVVARASGSDGVVELSFSSSGDRARLRCYLARDQRWLDRDIGFGQRRANLRTEISERGRLLGFAVATMFGEAVEPERAPPLTPPEPTRTAPSAPPPAASEPRDAGSRPAPEPSHRSIEFAGLASFGLGGSAGSLGASAGVRFRVAGPLWARGFVSGRTGDLPTAQASTRTALAGVGLAWSFLPEASRFEVGARIDTFAGYFDVTHLSEDDVVPDRRSRWMAGAALMTEAGTRLTAGTSVVLGLGVEGMLGKTEVYTHGNRVAVVPPFRVVAEVGVRSRF